MLSLGSEIIKTNEKNLHCLKGTENISAAHLVARNRLEVRIVYSELGSGKIVRSISLEKSKFLNL